MKRPSPSLVVSIAALVVATGGTSFAAAGMITGANVVDGSLQFRDLSAIAQRKLTGQKGATGARGPQGPAGTNGADGAAGAPGPTGQPGAPGAPGTPGATGQQGPAGVGRWILINPDGSIGGQSGGFTIAAAYPTLGNTATPPADNSLRANGNFYINANEPLTNNGIVATLTLENTVDVNGDAVTTGRAPGSDTNPEFSGEITVSRCNVGDPTTPPNGPTNCAPASARNANSFVVSPRNSDGSFTRDAIVDDPTTTANEAQASTRKAFYVVITGDSSDFVAPTGP